MLNAEEMIRQLKPLLGKRADRIWKAYLQGDTEDRKIIQHSLENLHAQMVDNYAHEKIILPPPTTLAEMIGTYPLGEIWFGDKPLYPFALLEEELLQHIGIFGRTGSGKSYLVRHILSTVLQHKPVLVLDWKGTYADLCAKNVRLFQPGSTSRPFTFNPLDLEGIPEEHRKTYIRQVIDFFLDCYLADLNLLTVHGVEFLLLRGVDELLEKKETITFHDLNDWLSRFKGKYRETDWKTSALDLLYKLINGPLGKVMSQSDPGVAQLARQKTILELHNTGSTKDKSFFIRTLLLRLYYHFQQQGATNRMRLFLVIEESHNILLKKGTGYETIIELMLRQIREFGVGVCIVDQHPSLISLPALGTYCTVAFNLKLRQDRDAMASALNLERTEYLGRLPPRFAIVKIQDRFLTPFLIRTFDRHTKNRLPAAQTEARPDQEIPSTDPPKTEGVTRVTRKEEKLPGNFSPVTRAPREIVEVIRQASKRGQKQLLWEEIFLIHIYAHPLMGSIERYRQLGLNDYQGNRHRTSLVEKALVTMESVATSTGRNRLMVPTEKGFAWLNERGFTTHSDKEGSIQHQYWKRRLRDQFRRQELSVKTEVDIGGNRAIDLLVSDGKKQVGVEVETGKNTHEQMVSNIEKGLEFTEGVVCLILKDRVCEKVKAMVKEDRAAIVADESRCLDAVLEILKGDGD